MRAPPSPGSTENHSRVMMARPVYYLFPEGHDLTPPVDNVSPIRGMTGPLKLKNS